MNLLLNTQNTCNSLKSNQVISFKAKGKIYTEFYKLSQGLVDDFIKVEKENVLAPQNRTNQALFETLQESYHAVKNNGGDLLFNIWCDLTEKGKINKNYEFDKLPAKKIVISKGTGEIPDRYKANKIIVDGVADDVEKPALELTANNVVVTNAAVVKNVEFYNKAKIENGSFVENVRGDFVDKLEVSSAKVNSAEIDGPVEVEKGGKIEYLQWVENLLVKDKGSYVKAINIENKTTVENGANVAVNKTDELVVKGEGSFANATVVNDMAEFRNGASGVIDEVDTLIVSGKKTKEVTVDEVLREAEVSDGGSAIINFTPILNIFGKGSKVKAKKIYKYANIDDGAELISAQEATQVMVGGKNSKAFVKNVIEKIVVREGGVAEYEKAKSAVAIDDFSKVIKVNPKI